MMTVTTHVLDTARGLPAGDIAVRLEIGNGTAAWLLLSEGRTGEDGRLSLQGGPAAAVHRLVFATADHLARHHQSTFFPEVVVSFRPAAEHCHVPLLLSPYGYSTYRGS